MFSSSCCFFPRANATSLRKNNKSEAAQEPRSRRCSDANVYAVAVAFVLVIICAFTVVHNLSAPTSSLS